MLDTQPAQPLCSHCKFRLAKANGISTKGFTKWHKYCAGCSRMLYDPRFSHLSNKKLSCEGCEFVAEDRCQLDLVYLDGCKKNKESKNLRTLCANCARLYKKKNRKKTILDITVDSDVRIK